MQAEIAEQVSLEQIKNRGRLLANGAMLLTAVFWGLSFISIKVVVQEIPPLTMAFARFLLAALILWGILCQREPEHKLQQRDLPGMILAGLLGITLYFYCENSGVKLTTAANAALIVALVPIITILLDIIFFGSPLGKRKMLAIGVAMVGSYLAVSANGQVDFRSETFFGNILMVGAMLSWAAYTLVSKSLQSRYSGLAMTTYQTLSGTALLAPLTLLEYQQWQPVSLTAFLHLLFLAVCCSVIGYILYLYALKRLDVTATTLYLNLVPVIGLLGGCWFLGESVFPIQVVGGLLTLAAIIVVNSAKVY